MAWAYCKCGLPVPQPSLREVLKNTVYCPHCGQQQEVDICTRHDAMDELVNRLEQLEKTQ